MTTQVKTLSYVEAIGAYYPGCFVSCSGDPSIYGEVIWEGGVAMPSKDELDLRTSTDTKERIWDKIKELRDSKKNHGIHAAIDGDVRWFHSDPDSRIQQLGLKDQARDVLMAGGTMTTVMKKLGQDIWWKSLSPGDRVPMTCQLAFDLVEAIGNLDAMLFHVAEVHHAAMELSEHPESYDYTVGWPEQFLS